MFSNILLFCKQLHGFKLQVIIISKQLLLQITLFNINMMDLLILKAYQPVWNYFIASGYVTA